MYNDLLFTVLEFVGNFHIYLKGNVMLHLAKPSTYSVKTKVSFFNFPHFFNHRLYLCVYKKPSVIGQKETFERNLEKITLHYSHVNCTRKNQDSSTYVKIQLLIVSLSEAI